MFIYVTRREHKERLEALGYELLKSNGNGMWVFVNKDTKNFEVFDFPCVVSDLLMF